MSYDKDQPFEQRIKVNTAETKFEEYCASKNVKFYKYGIDNHPFGKLFYNVNKLISMIVNCIMKNHLRNYEI
jgi:hypothetical protein